MALCAADLPTTTVAQQLPRNALPRAPTSQQQLHERSGSCMLLTCVVVVLLFPAASQQRTASMKGRHIPDSISVRNGGV